MSCEFTEKSRKRKNRVNYFFDLWKRTMYAYCGPYFTHCQISGNDRSAKGGNGETFPVSNKLSLCSLHVGRLKFPGDDGEYHITARDLEYIFYSNIDCLWFSFPFDVFFFICAAQNMVIQFLKKLAEKLSSTMLQFFSGRTRKSVAATTEQCTKWSIVRRLGRWL